MAIESTPGILGKNFQKPLEKTDDGGRGRRVETARGKGEVSGVRADAAEARHLRRPDPEVVGLRARAALESTRAAQLQAVDQAADAVSGVLGRLAQITGKASDASLSDTARGDLEAEFSEAQLQFVDITRGVVFGGENLLAAEILAVLLTENDLALQEPVSLRARDLGLDGLSIATPENAEAAVLAIDAALERVAALRDHIAAVLDRLDRREVENRNAVEDALALSGATPPAPADITGLAGDTRDQILANAVQALASQGQQKPETLLSLLA